MKRGSLISIIFLMIFNITSGFAEEKPLNVVLFLVDDLRPDLNCYGNDLIHSPNIDKLATEGVMFKKAYCQQAICAPSRMSILTGLRPETFAIYDIFTRFDNTHPQALTLPKLFNANGYKTVSIGKVFHHGNDNKGEWDVYHGKEGNSYHIPGNEELKAAFEGADVEDNAYKDGRAAQHAIDELKTLNGEKFVMCVGLSKPHLPFNAPKKYWDLYDKKDFRIPLRQNPVDFYEAGMAKWGELRGYGNIPGEGYLSDSLTLDLINGYYACVSYIDAQVGKVMQTLEELNLRENTMVVIMGDHGWKLGEFGAWCKHSNYNIDINAPLIISRETSYANRKTNVQSEAIVEYVDLLPTLAEACDINIPKRDGKSLVPLLDNPSVQWSNIAYSLYAHGEFRMGVTCTNGEYRYVEWRNFKTLQLYGVELYPCDENYFEKAKNLATVPAYDSIENVMRELLHKQYPPNRGSYAIPHMPDETILDDNEILFKKPSPGQEFEYGEPLKVEALVGDSINSLTLLLDSFTLRTINGGNYLWGVDSVVDNVLFHLTSGTHKITLLSMIGNDTLASESINISVKAAPVPQGPYQSNAIVIPGRIEAENYDTGGEGLAYHDNDDNNETGLYRTDGVDIVAAGSGYSVDNNWNNEWLEYTIDVKEDGMYDFVISYSSGANTGSPRVSLSLPESNTEIATNFSLYFIVNWDSFFEETVAQDISLTKGKHVLRVKSAQKGFYLDWIEISGEQTGIKSLNSPDSWVYPNPNCGGLFRLSLASDYTVFSIDGTRVKSGTGTTVDLSSYSKGIYLLQTSQGVSRLVFR